MAGECPHRASRRLEVAGNGGTRVTECSGHHVESVVIRGRLRLRMSAARRLAHHRSLMPATAPKRPSSVRGSWLRRGPAHVRPRAGGDTTEVADPTDGVDDAGPGMLGRIKPAGADTG